MLILIDELRRHSAIVYIADVLGTQAHITPYSELLRRSNPTGKAAARRAVAAVVGMFDAFGFGDAANVFDVIFDIIKYALLCIAMGPPGHHAAHPFQKLQNYYIMQTSVWQEKIRRRLP